MKKVFLIFVVAVVLINAPSWAQEMASNKIENMISQQMQSDGKSKAEFHQVVGNVNLSSKDYEKAILNYQKAVGLDPSLFISWYNLGLLYIGSDEGQECFKNAVKANPEYAPPYYWLAYNYCRDGNDRDAIKFFEGYLKVAAGSDEEARISTATKALEELRSGVEGETLKNIRDRH